MNTQSPYEQIKFINEAIKDRQEKNEPTFFSVKVERQGELTPMVNKERGENFYETILQYLTKYDLSAILIELYHGKSHNVKEPFQQFRILLKKSSHVSLGSVLSKDDIQISPTETLIPLEKHYHEVAQKERSLIGLEFDNKRLQYENEVLRRKNKKKKQYIQELESELGKIEKDKKNSLGNVSFGMIGANAIESFAKSEVGLGILKNVFGAKQEFLEGLLGTTLNEPDKKEPSEIRSTASIITKTNSNSVNATIKNETPLSEEEKIRQGIKKFINDFLNKNNDTVLRLYYELIQNLGTDTETLQSVLLQVKTYREKQKSFIEKKIKENNLSQKGNDDSRSGENSHQETDINDSS